MNKTMRKAVAYYKRVSKEFGTAIEVLEAKRIVVRMPEGAYHGNAVLLRKRYELDGPVYRDVEIVLDRPIPFKLGDEVYSMILSRRTSIDAGVETLRKDILRDRKRYVGKDWVPKRLPPRSWGDNYLRAK